MKTYLFPILLLLTTGCAGTDMTRVHLDRQCRTKMSDWCHSEYKRLQEERMDRTEAKLESRGKEM